MKHRTINHIFLFLFLISGSGILVGQNEIPTDFCISQEEQKLFNSINDYRKALNLSQLSLSPSLCYVASQHINDLITNHPDTNMCNFHSWSDKGSWQACCYEKEVNNKKCMQEKPLELTTYPGLAFEIIYWENGFASANSAFDQWRNIPASRAILTNYKEWESYSWNTIGISIKKGFAVAWFGEDYDPVLEIKVCGTNNIIKIEPPKDPDEGLSVSTEKGRYYIIIGSKNDLESAKNSAKGLRSGPYKSAKVVIKDNKYRISIADYATQDLALTAKKELPAKHKDAWILPF